MNYFTNVSIAIVFLTLLISACSSCPMVMGVRYSTRTKIVDYPLPNTDAEKYILPGDKLINIEYSEKYAKVTLERDGKIMVIPNIKLSCVYDLKDEDKYWK